MSDYNDSGMTRTDNKTASGERIYHHQTTNRSYSKDSYGNFHAMGGDSGEGSYADEHPNTRQYTEADGKAALALVGLTISGFIVNVAQNFINFYAYRRIFGILPIVFLVLPFLHEKFRKKYKFINILFMGSLLFYLFPKVDAYLGSSTRSNFMPEYLMLCGLNAGATALIIYFIYKIVRHIQKSFKIGLQNEKL
ncbi:hypothetical protein [Clostridium sp.]|uniref:hypothetical protein n=1 Tax=Clostridium sp. TaxID=1506 RepID=UPI003D6D0D50